MSIFLQKLLEQSEEGKTVFERIMKEKELFVVKKGKVGGDFKSGVS